MTASVQTKPSRAGGLWKRWRFHLSALLLILPLAMLPVYFSQLAMFSGTSGLGAREIGDKTVGPWTLRLAELNLLPPLPQGAAGHVKIMALALKGTAVTEVRAAYIKIGKPRSLRAAGAIFFGSPYRQVAGLATPERTGPDAEVWLTLEGWDGSVHQASLPLREASPVTAEWLAAQGGRR